MRMYDIIHKKREGGELSSEEIEFFVKGYTEGIIPDYQASALAMAILFSGMTYRETADLTMSMANSGDMVDLSRFGSLSVDKHSTGGVGDKTTLIVAPIVASLGAKVAKMSGRGLGHTGGTVDKLESIEGYKTSLDADVFVRQVEDIGIAVIGQTGNLAPCDKKLYALRDVTATVESMPLIVSSIMSKKIAAGARSIVFDVKYGSGAFMKTPEDAVELAEQMVKIGKACGRNTAALITNMDKPLGSAIGNALEVKEAAEILKGDRKDELRTVCEALASNMISLALGIDLDEAEKMVTDAIDSGLAYKKLLEWVTAQGGNAEVIENTALLPTASVTYEVKSSADGYVTKMDTEKIGISAVILGAGRESKSDTIDFSAGIVLSKKTGDRVLSGDVIATLHTSDVMKAKSAEKLFLSAVEISSDAPDESPLIYKVIR